MARNVMEQIVDHGKVVRGHLGISIPNVDADMAKAFGLSEGDGALVADVTPGNPAAKAGIEMGDIILELNGQPVSAPDDLSLHISQERADCHTTRKSYKTALTVGWSVD